MLKNNYSKIWENTFPKTINSMSQVWAKNVSKIVKTAFFTNWTSPQPLGTRFAEKISNFISFPYALLRNWMLSFQFRRCLHLTVKMLQYWNSFMCLCARVKSVIIVFKVPTYNLPLRCLCTGIWYLFLLILFWIATIPIPISNFFLLSAYFRNILVIILYFWIF